MSEDTRDQPLVSDRSPSLARARAEREHPSPTADADEIAVLNRLVEAEVQAAAVCREAQSALQRVGAPRASDALAEVQDGHGHNRSKLTAVIAALGASAPEADECGPVLAQSPEDMGYLGDEAAVIAAVTRTEDELLSRYREAEGRAAMPAQAQAPLREMSEALTAKLGQLKRVTSGDGRI
ncbi:hypothetical protein [Haliangium ochraceum]|uniref:DUF2383 domain-containing protein n=1 Tax=Haliangium ochraceum (strain DSM 14365 / JCM 11303 / SMP-2) TaxID=502025 RepID=D0LGC5_HALO1|nr:hypothetical protein [Haliangium ochraceum]ACY18150.1 hypothetical protein Hoch_5673 [Haliangium ochraceum DSM 14365]